MTKKNGLLAAVALLSICAMYAFSYPEKMRENVLTILFPEKELPIAVEHPAPEKATIAAPSLDTFPPLSERYDDFINGGGHNPIDLHDPKAIDQQVEYDPISNMYILTEKVGEDYYRAPTYMTFEEYMRWRDHKQQQEYFDRLQGVSLPGAKSAAGSDDPVAKFDFKNTLIDRLFGGTNVDIKPQGNINLTFGFDYQNIQNPILTRRQQRNGNFDFDMDINMSAQGKIGEKLNLNFNYNTQATFDFDNQMKLKYDTKNFSEDEILQNVEAGNVSMPLRSNLIKGVQNLFGIKTEMKFGHLRTTLIASQQRSKQQTMKVQGGSQVQEFSKPIDEYDENRHFFVSHWNRNQFEPAMKCLPVPQSLFNITRMEVWITNDRGEPTNTRDIVALSDMGEADLCDPAWVIPNPPTSITGEHLPANQSNGLYTKILDDLTVDSSLRFSDRVVSKLTGLDYNMKQIKDFEKVNARQLNASEFTYHEQLGFISVNLNVQPDQVLGVALEYTYNGVPYKIGEFSSDISKKNSIDTLKTNVLFVKMLKSTTANIQYPIWDLMMKNVYAIGTANVDPQEFRFDVFYEDPGKGQKRFLSGDDIPTALKAKPLLQVFRLDNLNLQGDPGPDGIFDFVPGLTINLRSGRIMFPVLEPFGSYMSDKITEAGGSADVAEKYAYPQLYDLTPFKAREFQQLNRFTLKGTYKSSTSSEISLGTFNLPRGSVRVSGGGRQLIEGVDYSVDYNIGKVKILNDAILQSGQNVNVSFEDNTFFGFQSRSMIGARFDYEVSKDFTVGATFMNLFERPLTQKVNFGDDPINNKIYGADFSISKDAPWLTKLVDKLPLIETKEASTITAQAEVAVLQPGHNKAINQGGDEGGVVYLDDFEGSTANLPLTNPSNQWVIASVPQGDLTLFPESISSNEDLSLGANRAGLSWYIADPSARNESIDGDDPYTTLIQYQDIFPNRQISPYEQSSLRPLDVTFYPRERGPYNFELPDGYSYSKGLTPDGQLKEPDTRWAGFMRELSTNDFEASNIEFVEFWMMNPYMNKKDGSSVSDPGAMYLDLGSISEDIMRDSRQFFENGLPTSTNNIATDNSTWGRVPIEAPVVNAFDNQPNNRVLQDLGLDGLNDADEASFFSAWYNTIQNAPSTVISDNTKALIKADPANDNFKYFRDPAFDNTAGLLTRYRKFNNQQGNSPVNESSNLNPSATNYPDQEDLNRDRSLNETEAYFRYKINLPKTVVNGQEAIDITDPSIRDLITTEVTDPNGYTWYRFKVPLDLKTREAIGGIQDFRSVRFIRMFWKGFTERTTFRFATLELGRNQWRRFTQPLPNVDPDQGPGICDVGFDPEVPFDVNAVSIEENSARVPFNYTIPFGIKREQSVGAFPDILQNEQSLAMSICELKYCDARAVFKTLNLDLRQYKRLKMFAHAEAKDQANYPLDGSDLKIFIRMGSDFVRNYYEYEIPLIPSDPLNLNGNPDSREYKEEVWRPENQFDFPLELFTDAKKERNANTTWPLEMPFIISDPEKDGARVKVVGNPNLGYVKGVMIGVRNADETNNKNNLHCVEVWLNELRLNGFNEKGGYAGQARMDVKMADFGNLSFAGNYSSIGWGSIEEKIAQRQREEVIQYDVSTNLELGKLLPEKAGLKLPFYAQYSNITKNPEYDPYDLDIKLKDKIRDNPGNPDIKHQAQDVTTIRGYNFTNVRKERKGKPRKVPLPWNVENFSLTYAYNQLKNRTPFILSAAQDQYKGGVDWQYATGLKPLTPFKKLIKKDKYLKFITDFNFNPLPETYGFNTTLDRLASTTTYRFAGEDPRLNTYYNRRFTWDRNYDLGWTIAKTLRFNFDATARSIIDEPSQYAEDGHEYTIGERRDILWNNFKTLGRPKAYNHSASLNYTLPFKSIPFMDWVTVKASYSAGYTWTAQSLKLQNLDAGDYQNQVNERSLGNTIQNNNTRQINGDFNLETLYNKSKYLQKINKPGGKGGKDSKGKSGKDDDLRPGSDDDGAPGAPGAPGRRPGPPGGGKPGGGKVPSPSGKDGGLIGGGDPSKASDPRKSPTANPSNPADPGGMAGGGTPGAPGGIGSPSGADPAGAGAGGKTPGGKGKAGADPGAAGSGSITDRDEKGGKGSKEKKERQPSLAERIALRPLMLVRKARLNYTETFSTIIPGFTPDTKLMGLSEGFDAPGWAFVAGVQPNSAWLDDAGRNGWITHRPELNQQVMRNYTQNFDGSVTVEPFQDFRVEVTANKQFSRNSTELYKDQDFNLGPDAVNYEHRAQRDMGSFTVSYFSMQTLFNNDINGLFSRYETNRPIVSQRLGYAAGQTDPHPVDHGYTQGFGRIQQEVLIPSFVSAYTDADPRNVELDIFKTLPSVNWKLNYNGLNKIGNLNKIFSSVQISHGYKNTLTVNSYNTDLFYDASKPYTIDELNYNYIARYEIPQVVIDEQMQPLFGLDMKFKNEMTLKGDFKKSRRLAMSFIDYQLAESRSTSYSAGFGYRIKNVNIPFLTGKKKTQATKKKTAKKKSATTPPVPGSTGGSGNQSNDLTFKFDFEVRDDITINHLLDSPNQAVPTRGSRTVSINPAVEYALNKRLKLRLFTDYRKTVPKTSQSFPITTLSSGITVQFSLN